ncbi:fungal-specific transcription factor domain-containing protein [Annulohypoxylon truncatum]|uniref:fungal-specific transcription factor domain-containing protein n=1 Tax=Annulohypoxylon truncatum TaxID=327061 RepID=UPI00200816E5|nr:fungal-specific transcription factor domain-containing protein [Annulohypoxylon truncatum]KAI1212071.1 fungal-specific transcription factor domain-containing protein [Annulohypoxylon truncatum]
MASSAPSWPGVRPVKTCTECKQSKLRCDSKDMFPNPCSRCQARKLTCTVDPSFRRTPARKRLEAMSRELRELRDQKMSTSRAGSTTSPDPDSTRSQDSSCNTSHPSAAILLEDFELLGLETFELGGVAIDKQSVIEIFKLFTELFHPHIPIIGPISLKNIYHSHRFLFWTIIIIVAFRAPLPSDENLFNRLHEPYMALLRAEALIAPMPLSKIQAFLFLCVWPMPVSHQQDDPSWLYCGVAVNAALYMSLHRSNPKSGITPSLYSVGNISGSSRERSNTWLGCFYVSTSLSMHLGLPPLINSPSDLASVRAILSEHSIPREFALQIRVLLIMAGFSNVLAHNSNDGVVDSSVTQLLDGELDTLKLTYPDGWTSMTDYTVMVVKMHVYTMVITRSRPGASSRDILLKLGLATSLRIIHLANLRFQETPDKSQTMTTIERERTLPKNYFRALAFATIFLLRYFGLNNGNSSAEEQQLAANHVIMSHTIFKSATTKHRDEYDRVASLFETLCKQAPAPPDTSKTNVTGRMGISILLDGIGAAREMRGFPIEIPEPEASSTTDSLPGPSSIPQADIFDASSQLVEPWQSDLAFANMFWGDPTWDVYNMSADTPQYHPSQGL